MNQRSNPDSKFTRGEKCLFTHLVLTFCFLFIAVLIYLIHLYLVGHTFSTVFSTRRQASANLRLNSVPVGVIYLKQTNVRRSCNTLLLRNRWSVGPGHCIALITHPDLSHLLLHWRLKYRYNDGVNIKRTIVHPHFDTGTFENNIGVMHHDDIISLQTYNLPNINYDKLFYDDNKGKLIIVTWQPEIPLYEDGCNTVGAFPVQLLPPGDCKTEMASIVDIRSYETCVVFEKAIYTTIEHGAIALQMNSLEVFGFVTWGDKLYRTYPVVILNLSYFQDWLDFATTM